MATEDTEPYNWGALTARVEILSEEVAYLRNPDANEKQVRLFFDFQKAIERLWRKYGVIEVQEMARGWVEFIDIARARNEQIDEDPS